MDRLREAGARLADPASYNLSSPKLREQSERQHLDYMKSESMHFHYLMQFDALTTIFVGIARLLAAGTLPTKIHGQELYDAMLTTPFEGLTGPVNFSSDGEREASYSVT